jgi:hypothetical protein
METRPESRSTAILRAAGRRSRATSGSARTPTPKTPSPRTSASGWFAEGLEAKPRDSFRATVDMATGGRHGLSE